MEYKEQTNNFFERLADLAPKTVGVVPWLREPTYEQKEFFNHKMRGSARTWETCIEHKPWVLRWQYFILEDYNHGC